MNNFFTEPQASELDELRERTRRRCRLTFDCYNAIYPQDHQYVYCKLGYPLSQSPNGKMPLLSVLKGRIGSYCRACCEFNGD